LKHKEKTKVVALADDLILVIRADSTRALEKYSNSELNKITARAKRTKSNSTKKIPKFLEEKLEESRALNVYLNHKKL